MLQIQLSLCICGEYMIYVHVFIGLKTYLLRNKEGFHVIIIITITVS
jgi:hypothetical protein